MRQVSARRDPAPSRTAYRMHRLMLTPRFRAFLKFGLPILVIAGSVAAYLGDDVRRADALAAVEEARRQIENRPEFTVNLIAVDGASDEVADAIRAAVPVDVPVSSFDVDLADIRARVAALEAVETAAVRIRTGGVLDIQVTERVPVALWRSSGGLAAIDVDGNRVTSLISRTERPNLPLLAGDGAQRAVPEAMELLAAAAPLEDRLRGLLRVGERRWDLVLDRGQRVLLPEDAPIAALERVLALDEAQELFARDIALIDMRNPERPTVRLTASGIDALRQVYDLQAGADGE